ncbi:MAG: hypothetical protein HKN78_06205 [Sphingomonadaceae bacterium]|nr:hypothetical protein [Sphingomonadaceae bacterium]
MIASEAHALLGSWLAPLTTGQFLDDVLGKRLHVDRKTKIAARQGLFGPDPRKTLLQGYRTLAAKIGPHAANPSGPPPGRQEVASAADFGRLIGEYHQRGYTVRIPEAEQFSLPLARFLRALELVLGKPARAEIFWSATDLTAPVHYDDYDIIVVHLHGQKRWFVADEEPRLSNPWKQIGEPPPVIERHSVHDLAVGDLLYCPRGTSHTVASPSESLHLSIGFSQLTVREAVQAALDHFADIDRPLRDAAGKRGDAAAQGEPVGDIAAQIRSALGRLDESCRSAGFVAEALDHRMSRTVAELPSLGGAMTAQPVTAQSAVRHTPLAIAHVRETNGVIDFSQPGGHVPMHIGAADSVRFVAETPAFRVGELPGEIGDDVRVALVTRLIGSGFLEVAT